MPYGCSWSAIRDSGIAPPRRHRDRAGCPVVVASTRCRVRAAVERPTDLCDEPGIPFERSTGSTSGSGCRDRARTSYPPTTGRSSPASRLCRRRPREAEILRVARVWEGPRRVAGTRSGVPRALEVLRRKGSRRSGARPGAVGGGRPGHQFCRRPTMDLRTSSRPMPPPSDGARRGRLRRRPSCTEGCPLTPRCRGSVRYTALTDRLGDQVSVDIVLRLAELTQEVAERHGGRVVKMLGDGVTSSRRAGARCSDRWTSSTA
jgi:hypothetical protein